MVDFDIRSCFDSIPHDRLLAAVAHHTDIPWVQLYVRRWLETPTRDDGSAVSGRGRGVVQGSSVSPVLANLFLHYAFDMWMAREFPAVPFERYADDSVAHCASFEEAVQVRDAVAARLAVFGMELHPEKTRIVYCKDADRRGVHEVTSFTFLGYTFRPRLSRSRWGKHFVNFTPAVSREAVKRMSREIRSWHIPRRSDKSLQDLARMFNRIVQGWINYFGRFYKSMLYPLLQQLNMKLVLWAMRKYKRLRRRERQTRLWLRRIARQEPSLFAHWRFGAYP